LSLLSYSSAFSIPTLKVKGSHYDVGFQVGTHFSDRIANYIQNSEEVNKVLLPFSKTGEGRAAIEQFLTLNERAYPQYFDELRGLSQGSGVPLSTLVMLQFADELEAGWITPKTSKSNCADIHVQMAGQSVIVGHNEDAEPIIKQTAYIVEYEIPDSNEHFVAYTYPGRLPGDAWGFSVNANLTFSMNWVGPLPVSVGLARGFINRAIFGASSLSDALTKATPDGRSFGFTLNIGDITRSRSWSVEVAPVEFGIFEVERNYSHFNMYKILTLNQIPDISTVHRQSRCNQLPIPASVEDVRSILGDTQDTDYPIYRVATTTDPEDTVVTAIFDITNLVVYVWDDNPKLNSPGLQLKLSSS